MDGLNKKKTFILQIPLNVQIKKNIDDLSYLEIITFLETGTLMSAW